jgi:hypothetical protein
MFEMWWDGHKAALGKGACWTSTSLVDVEPPVGVMHDAKETGGGSQPEE